MEVLGRMMPALVEAEKAAVAEKEKDKSEPLIRSTDEAIIRGKSPAVLAMLRAMIGQEKLLAVLRKYHAADDNEPHYLQSLVAATVVPS